MTIPVPTIDATGMSIPTYAAILAGLQAEYRSIYGTDVVLDADTQDGQWLAIQASALNDANSMALAVYNAFSPATAQGVGLSSVVKINGIKRMVATNSTVDVEIGGANGTTINNGIVGDVLEQQWALPSVVNIPALGTVTVTATAVNVGAVEAQAKTVTSILTPTRGWQTVTNALPATPGAPVESDGELRLRQSSSAALPALSPLVGIYAAIANVTGVQRFQVYENDTDATDGNGLPEHSISVVVEGGDTTDIAETILLKKTPGAYTYGTTSEVVYDARGLPSTIRFFRATPVSITVEIDVQALVGWSITTEDVIKQAVADYINAGTVNGVYVNGGKIGDDVYLSRLYTPANLGWMSIGATFDIAPPTGIRIARTGSPTPANVTIAFNEVATCDVSDITITTS